jgi:hypothetical protein
MRGLATVCACAWLSIGCAGKLTRDVLNSGYDTLHDPKQKVGAAYLDTAANWRELVRALARELVGGGVGALDDQQLKEKAAQLSGDLLDKLRAQADDATRKWIDSQQGHLKSVLADTIADALKDVDTLTLRVQRDVKQLEPAVETSLNKLFDDVEVHIRARMAKWPNDLTQSFEGELPKVRPIATAAANEALAGLAAVDQRTLDAVGQKIADSLVRQLLKPLDDRWANVREVIFAAATVGLGLLLLVAVGAYFLLARRHRTLRKLLVVVGQGINELGDTAVKHKITEKARNNYVHKELTDYLKLNSV